MSAPVTFTPTALEGVVLVETRVFGDARGYFTEAFNQSTWREQGFDHAFVQDNVSMSAKGTLRGMHFQLEPHATGKLVRALRGAAFDVAVDLRKGSPTYGQWTGHTLSEENGLAMWIPVGFAHGFLALEERTLIYYKCTSPYTPGAERTLSYKDPEVAIAWPSEPRFVNERDASAPPLSALECNFTW